MFSIKLISFAIITMHSYIALYDILLFAFSRPVAHFWALTHQLRTTVLFF